MQSGTLHWHLWDSHCWEIFAAHYLSPSAGTSLCVARDHLLCTTEVARGKSNYHSKITSSNWKNLDRISLSWILFPLRNDVLLCMVDPPYDIFGFRAAVAAKGEENLLSVGFWFMILRAGIFPGRSLLMLNCHADGSASSCCCCCYLVCLCIRHGD